MLAVWRGADHEIREFPDDQSILVSRVGNAEICLADDYVSAPHARLRKERGVMYVEALGTNPTWLDGQRIPDETPVALAVGAVITIRSFKIVLLDKGREAEPGRDLVLARVSEIERELYEKTFEGIDFKNIALLPDRSTEEGCDVLRGSFDDAFGVRSEAIYGEEILCEALISRLFLRLLLARLAATEDASQFILGANEADGHLPIQMFVKDPTIEKILRELSADVEQRYNSRAASGERCFRGEIALDNWTELARLSESRLSRSQRRDLIREDLFRRVVNLAFELGPLQDMLAMPGVTEILIVGHERIFMEMGGRLRQTADRFPSAPSARRVLERAVSRAGRRIDMSQPVVDVGLPDGSRLHAVIAPLSRSGDVLSIRRFRPVPFTLADLERSGMYSASVGRFFAALVVARKNVVVSGGTGSGKTTLLGALASQVGPTERIVLIEDTAEIRVPGDLHVVSLQARQPNVEGKGEVTIRTLVRNALRMRPDRLIVGECRGPEVMDMLQAMNTGHPGSLTTLHANSPDEVPSRIETMALQGINLPLEALRRQIADALEIVVHLTRRPDGTRSVSAVAEVVGIDPVRGSLDIVPILELVGGEPRSSLRFTGWLPTFIDELESAGLYRAEDFLD